MTEKEYFDQEYKVEVKMVAILSVDHINELKDKIPELMQKGFDYNYEYCMENKSEDGTIALGSRNAQKFLALQISEYNRISEEEKDFVNNVVVPSRRNRKDPFRMTKEDFEEENRRIKEYAKIWRKQDKDLEEFFIDTKICKKVLFDRRRGGVNSKIKEESKDKKFNEFLEDLKNFLNLTDHLEKHIEVDKGKFECVTPELLECKKNAFIDDFKQYVRGP
ncbi:MAG: hypothetical protein GF317_20780 [Candidatus Lokiarchaeota archaeon]|nr:hypothetical protein [Candidatus Lokiarchaeota archaeon]